MMTNLRSILGLLRTARKLAIACTFAIVIPGAAAAQTNTFPTSGNVGIGTASPQDLLHVSSSADTKGIRVLANSEALIDLYTSNTNSNARNWRIASNVNNWGDLGFIVGSSQGATPSISGAKLTILNSGNVGIGTAMPSDKLHINAGAGNHYYRLQVNNATTQDNAWEFGDGSNPYWYAGVLGSTVGGNKYTIRSNSLNILNLTTDGNVGIGNSSPTEKLHVTGNISVTGTGNITATGTIEAGNIKAKYQDLAEWVPSSEQLSAGTVVVLDTTKSNQVISSGSAYDTRVAGVISAQPGISLGESGEGKVLVATTGRVRVKVDASRGAIQIGDLLVTSDVPGVAMKSEAVNLGGVHIHRPGTIVGKALEPLVKGSGEILVLLSLQ